MKTLLKHWPKGGTNIEGFRVFVLINFLALLIFFRELKKSIGLEGDIEVETEAILIENGIDYSEFDEKVMNIEIK